MRQRRGSRHDRLMASRSDAPCLTIRKQQSATSLEYWRRPGSLVNSLTQSNLRVNAGICAKGDWSARSRAVRFLFLLAYKPVLCQQQAEIIALKLRSPVLTRRIFRAGPSPTASRAEHVDEVVAELVGR